MSGLKVWVWFLAAGVWCVVSGCGANYRWSASVPAEMRTVAVPTFRNESSVSEIGAVAARQILREFQREGTFRLKAVGDSALEVQGVVKSVNPIVNAYARETELRLTAQDVTAVVEVSVIDKRSRKVLVDGRRYLAKATLTVSQDMTTGLRDVSGRLMEDLARQVVDDVLMLKW